MRISNRFTTLIAACTLTLAACGNPATPAPLPAPAQATTVAPAQPAATAVPVPTATPVPPTATPVPPTATPLPPTATAIPPTATAQPAGGLDSVLAGMSKLNVPHRFTMTMDMSGLPGVGAVNVMDVKGEGQGANSRIALSGLTFSMFSGNDKPVEMVNVDGKTFVKGPMLLMGAPEAKWYVLSGTQQSTADPVRGMFGSENPMKSSSFKKTGSESIDGAKCDVYEGDQATLQSVFERAQSAGSGQVVAGAANMPKVEAGLLKVWACDDGFMHRMSMTAKLALGGSGQSVDMQMNMRMFDFGTKIDPILAPPNAEPAKAPALALPTSKP